MSNRTYVFALDNGGRVEREGETMTEAGLKVPLELQPMITHCVSVPVADKPELTMVGDLKNQTLYVFGESTIEAETAETTAEFPFQRLTDK